MNNKLSIIKKQEFENINKENYTFINFNYDYSIKIIPFYEKIDDKEIEKLKNLFFKLTNIDVRIDDLLGKLHLILLKLLLKEDKNYIFINSIGFSEDSLIFLIENINKMLYHFKDKNLIILQNESDQGLEFKSLRK